MLMKEKTSVEDKEVLETPKEKIAKKMLKSFYSPDLGKSVRAIDNQEAKNIVINKLKK